MTREEFVGKYRGQMLLFLTEAWSVRSLQPSQLGLVIDRHRDAMGKLLAEMYTDLAPPEFSPPAAASGHPARMANGRVAG